ncbi:hypothetical protein [Bradyrhizobium sp. Y36]|uniref:hypothetical protein n=1 Tax=Bradyrhizobium sp. Y36 TaxID=2035447 RepID=UPI0011781961|nr:hypothetical protein [Bradyrhizobium sp. Y36]
MALSVAFNLLETELDILANELRAFAAENSPLNAPDRFSLSDECLLEGLLSRVWQAWCGFARFCVIGSCEGTTTSAGVLVQALPDARSEEHVSSAVIRANSRSNPPYWVSTNATLRYEPTWGDVDVLNRVLTRLRPNNHLQLLAAFSSISSSAKVVQTIRNGVAHHNHQTLKELLNFQSAYIVFRIAHPTHAMFWVEPSTSDFLITSAIEELKVAAQAAIA